MLFCGGAGLLLVTAQSLGDRTQFLEVVFYCGVFCRRFSGIQCGGLIFISGRISGDFVARFKHISFGISAGPGGTTFFFEEGF